MAACVNCSARLIGSSIEFCSRQCSADYWAMEQTEPKKKEVIPMAKKTEVLVTLVDDLTGKEFTEGEGQTVRFTVNGQRYEIDMENKNVEAFNKAIAKYVSAAREVGSKTVTPGEPSEAAKVRAWALLAGKEVNDRGRIPAALMDEYRASQTAHTEQVHADNTASGK